MNRTEHNLRIVYLVTRRSDDKPVYSSVFREEARFDARFRNKSCGQHFYRVERCEVMATKRKGGGA